MKNTQNTYEICYWDIIMYHIHKVNYKFEKCEVERGSCQLMLVSIVSGSCDNNNNLIQSNILYLFSFWFEFSMRKQRKTLRKWHFYSMIINSFKVCKSTKLNESRHNPAPICRTPVWLHNLESTFTLNLYININNFVGLDNLRCVWLQGGEIVSLVWLLHQWMTNLKFVYFNQVNRE